MQCHMNGVVIDEVPKFLTCVPNETMHAIWILNSLNATQLITIPFKITRATSYFDVRKSTWEEYEDQDNHKIEIMTASLLQDPSSPEFSMHEQSMLVTGDGLSSLSLQQGNNYVLNSATLYAHAATDAVDDDNYATVLEGFVIVSPLQIAQMDIEKVPVLDHLGLAKKWGISPKKAINIIPYTTQYGVHIILHQSLSQQFRAHILQ